MANNDYQKCITKISKEMEILNSKIRELESTLKKEEKAPYPTALDKTLRFYPKLDIEDKKD